MRMRMRLEMEGEMSWWGCRRGSGRLEDSERSE